MAERAQWFDFRLVDRGWCQTGDLAHQFIDVAQPIDLRIEPNRESFGEVLWTRTPTKRPNVDG